MESNIEKTLISEFEMSWAQLFNIDNRRGFYFISYSATFFFVAIVSALIISLVKNPCLASTIGVSVAPVIHILFGSYLIGVYESERAANVRYRKKINLIREILLSKSGNPSIEMYLKQKEIGIKTYSGEGNEIDKLGGTLKEMYTLIHAEQVASGVIVALLWSQLVLSKLVV